MLCLDLSDPHFGLDLLSILFSHTIQTAVDLTSRNISIYNLEICIITLLVVWNMTL